MTRVAKYRLGLNTSQTHLRNLLALKSDVVIATMFRALRSNLDVQEAWPNNALAKSASLPFFTIQGIASETGLSTDTVDKYVHAFIGLTQDDPDYRAKRVTFDHPHAPLIIETKEPDGGFAYEIASGKPFCQINPAADETYTDEFGNEIILPFGALPHRLVSTRALLFVILAPTTIKSSAKSAVLKAARLRLTAEFDLPAVTSESIDGNYREFKRRPEDAFTSGSGEGNAEQSDQLDLFDPVTQADLIGAGIISAPVTDPSGPIGPTGPIGMTGPTPPSTVKVEGVVLPPPNWREGFDEEVRQAWVDLERAAAHARRLAAIRDALANMAEILKDIPTETRDKILYDIYLAKKESSTDTPS